ncbi:heparinase II/III family protein [Gammaproteobacteria bacterium]|nr:heparinase II/III family protein [Gammaproteobacteria bacterium]
MNQRIKAGITDSVPEVVIHKYLDHTFDLLGSGFQKIFLGMKARGIDSIRFKADPDNSGINFFNRKQSTIINNLLDDHYEPIDWHIDFKSGFKWQQSTWYRFIKHGHKLGVDIKVPWELSRMQHLPQMALRYSSMKKDASLRVTLKREFRNQVLDFIANNPPNYGVNWRCPMDISIRAANWLIAYDLFNDDEHIFDAQFKNIFTENIRVHGEHIFSNLEWYFGFRNNHYLANIAGLAFISSYLDSDNQTDGWLAFSIQELIVEAEYQFYDDGTNIEGSTSYHRLSAEMILYATAVILGLPKKRIQKAIKFDNNHFRTSRLKPKLLKDSLKLYEYNNKKLSKVPFPVCYFEKIEKMAEFIIDISKPNGLIPQIGDNDSGRFFKFDPVFNVSSVREMKKQYANMNSYDDMEESENYFMEQDLDCAHLVFGANAIFERVDFSDWLKNKKSEKDSVDYLIIKRLSNGFEIPSYKTRNIKDKKHNTYEIGSSQLIKRAMNDIKDKESSNVLIKEFYSNENSLKENLSMKSYPDFGIFLYTSNNLYLAIRCWPGRQPHSSSHMHHDQYTVELMIESQDLILDPGSYIYEPFPELRNLYRSRHSHCSPFLINDADHGMFDSVFSNIKIDPAYPSCFLLEGFLSFLRKDDYSQYFLVDISDHSVKICYVGDLEKNFHQEDQMKYSIGYGKVLN